MAKQHSRLEDRIVVDPSILVGKPVVRGTRISVEQVLSRLSVDLDLDAFFEDYPTLSIDDVRACIAYASAVVAGEEVYFLQPDSDVVRRA
jgi:uncharacterized protein (DUF433 family)